MSFMDGKPRIATAEEIGYRWLGGKPGERFRCSMCGHKFAIGDQWRCVYTNFKPWASGNPLVCKSCDGADDDVRRRWTEKSTEHYSEKNWHFHMRDS